MATRSSTGPATWAALNVPSLVRSTAPLAVLGLGAAATFAANIVARRTLAPEGFTEWAYLTSLLSFFFSFSLLGSEQLVVRLLDVQDRTSVVPRDAAQLIGLSFIGFGLAYVFVLDGRMFEYRLGILALPILVSTGIVQLLYQVDRAEGRLLAAQVSYNAWKLALPGLLIAAVALGHRDDASLAVGGALTIGLIVALVPMIPRLNRFRLGLQPSDARRIYLPFVLSLGTVAILGIVDRTMVERVHDQAAFADYVYLATILLTPFNILSSFFGFREAVKYRRAFSPTLVRSDTIRVALYSSVLVALWFGLCYATRALWHGPTGGTLWALLGATAVIRCGYGVLSAAMGVRGQPRAIYLANCISLAAIAAYFAFAMILHPSVEGLLAGFLGIWIVRTIAYYAFLVAPTATVHSDVANP